MESDEKERKHRKIGMIQSYNDADEQGKAGTLYDVGCAGRISTFSETDDGRYMITLSGVSRFKIDSFVECFSPFIIANINW